MSQQTPQPAIESVWFIHKTQCPECKRRRNIGDHTQCSKILQAKFAAENAARQKR